MSGLMRQRDRDSSLSGWAVWVEPHHTCEAHPIQGQVKHFLWTVTFRDDQEYVRN